MARLVSLLALAGIGSGAALLVGRAALTSLPPLQPDSPPLMVTLLQRWAPDPALRREASLLLAAKGDDPGRQHQLLRGQGWGHDPIAALVLKRDAEALIALGDGQAADRLWQQLLERFPTTPATADALYRLGRQQPTLRRLLRQQFPAHPAALAAAVEADDSGAAAHLARWGVRWPGAEALLRQRCDTHKPDLGRGERDLLARGLAQLGDPAAALGCLRGGEASPATQLAIGSSLLKQSGAAEERGATLLLQLAQRHPQTAEASEAAALLSETPMPRGLAALEQLPANLQQGPAVAARRALEAEDMAPTLTALRRWPEQPTSWELQWQRARQALLQRRWQEASWILAAPSQLPPALAARRLFWLGFSAWERGQSQQAREHWSELVQRHPGGYYGWRAAVRLGAPPLDPTRPARPRTEAWQPLNSGDGALDRLWRLYQPLEAWEHWRHHRGGRPAVSPQELVVEGRLRRAVGDHWIGLGQLEQATLRLPPRACDLQVQLESELHRRAEVQALEQAQADTGVSADLLAAVAKQESRFSPGVHSAAGAIGLLQLMPDTAAELVGKGLTSRELENPASNARLGALYLHRLLRQWRNDPWLTVASYNAGPGAVASWISPLLSREPELWVEGIPYPETRLYVKKVLGNLWSFQEPRPPRCGL